MKKFIIAFYFICFLCTNLFSQKSKINIGLVRGLNSVPFVCMDNNDLYELKNYETIESLIFDMKFGNIDVCNVSFFAAKSLVLKTNEIKACYISQTTDFMLISDDLSVKNFSDLMGKTIYLTKGGLSESLLRYLLFKNNVPVVSGESGVDLAFEKDSAEITKLLCSKKINYALLSEPYISIAMNSSKKIKPVIDLQDEYVTVEGEGKTIPLTVIIARRQFKEDNVDLYAIFEEDLKKSLLVLKNNPEKIAKKMQELNLSLSPYSIKSALKRANFCLIPIKNYEIFADSLSLFQ